MSNEEVIPKEKAIVIKTDDIVFDITELSVAALQAQVFADNLEIINDSDMKLAIEGVAEIKAEAKTGEEARKKVVDRPNKYVKSVNAYFKEPLDIFEVAVKKINTKMNFFRETMRIRAEEKQRIELEKYQEKVEAAKLEAARSGKPEDVIPLPKTFSEPAATIRTATASATFVEFNDYEVADIHAVYKSHPELVSLEIKRKDTLELLKTMQNVPGLVIFKNSTTRSR